MTLDTHWHVRVYMHTLNSASVHVEQLQFGKFLCFLSFQGVDSPLKKVSLDILSTCFNVFSKWTVTV